jgi:disulfide bond formation protein DsbB/thiol-disulfide isomerase/thioredoxin
VPSVSTATLFFALLAVAAQLALVTLVVAALAARRWPVAARLRAAVAAAPGEALRLAFVVALVATLGSLYLSEVAGLVPCTLCWFQRAAMYPLAVVLGVAAFRRDLAVRPYAVALAGAGAAVSAYHYLLERFPSLDAGACDPDNPCTLTWVWRFHYLSIPLMAGTAFALVAVLLLSTGPRQAEAAGVQPRARAEGPGGGRPRRLTAAALTRPGGGPPLVRAALVVVVLAGLVGGRSGVVATAPADADLPQDRPVQVGGEPLAVLEENGADQAVGRTAPELRGASFDGTPVAVTHDGTPKAVVFLAHWCPHCQEEVPVLVRWLANGRLPPGVELYAVSTAVRPELAGYPPSTWLREAGWPAPVLADDPQGSAAAAFGLSGFPFFVLLDGDGRVAARASGEQSPRDLDRLLASIASAAR